ncbi:hypothetical protein ACFFIS_04335 [Virgibacillus soli]|uniref:Uncharacterized protein n=1 Tax=Paracerasibacillus soli TaxID=480284 RepID=A0ABU5CUP1_9BACI|nr:hypothetical protein [Virgibacillus soli]MDY0409557.1 hypothetical protein [Virgibacillus soli]
MWKGKWVVHTRLIAKIIGGIVLAIVVLIIIAITILLIQDFFYDNEKDQYDENGNLIGMEQAYF